MFKNHLVASALVIIASGHAAAAVPLTAREELHNGLPAVSKTDADACREKMKTADNGRWFRWMDADEEHKVWIAPEPGNADMCAALCGDGMVAHQSSSLKVEIFKCPDNKKCQNQMTELGRTGMVNCVA